MPTIVALYTGSTIADAQIVAASCDPELVELVADRLLSTLPQRPPTPSAAALLEGKHRALELIRRERPQ